MIPPGTRNIPPDHPTQHGSPTFFAGHVTARESVVVALPPFLIDFRSARPSNSTWQSGRPTFCRSCHGLRICRRQVILQPKNPFASSFVCLSLSISVQHVTRVRMSKFPVARIYHFLITRNCVSRILPLLCILMCYVYKFYFVSWPVSFCSRESIIFK